MKSILTCLLGFLFIVNTLKSQEECPLIVGYIPFHQMDQYESIDWELLTHMNGSALRMDYEGNITFPGFDSTIFQNFLDYGKSINPSIKFSLSVSSFLTDFESNEIISYVANDSTATENLINQMVELVEFYDLDGFDVDWEFPLQR